MRMYRRYGDITWESAETIATAPAGMGAAVRSDRAARRNGKRFAPLAAESFPSIRLHGVRLHAITEHKCIEHILSELDAGQGGAVVTPNLDHLRRATRDLSFAALVAEADLVVPDGMPLIWASRLQGTPLPERVAGSDLISSLSRGAAARGRSIYLLGGAQAPRTRRWKSSSGTIPRSRSREHIAHRSDSRMIPRRWPKSVLCSLPPRRTSFLLPWVLRSRKTSFNRRVPRSVLPNAWWLGVGISFSFLSGEVARAPRWMQRIGMEWLHRLAHDPKRLFHRYVVVGLPFGADMMAHAVVHGLSRRMGFRGVTSATMFNASVNGDGENAAAVLTDSGAIMVIEPAPAPPPPRRRSVEGTARSGSLNRLRTMVLLGGSVRSSPLSDACGRSLLDLPLGGDGSIFNHWLAHASALAHHAALQALPVRVLVNRNTPEPISAAPAHYGNFRVERDLSEYRGTGGVLRDLAASYDDDDLILVCNASQILLDPLVAVATALDRKAGDFTLVSHNDGTPSGVMLAKCKTLRMIPETGFVDLKEQALALMAGTFDVTVLNCRRPTGLPVRSLTDYIVAMRHYEQRRAGKPPSADALSEDWMPAFALVEAGTEVDPRAHVHDSVVLKGGIVEAGAVVVRSIVCPGGAVKKDRHAVDQLIRGDGIARN